MTQRILTLVSGFDLSRPARLAVQDIALSRRRPEFDSPAGRFNAVTLSKYQRIIGFTLTVIRSEADEC